jgi:cobalt/nickel transport system permease protein
MMLEQPHTHGRHACLDRVDPRLRLIVAAALSVLIAVADRFDVLGVALAAIVVGLGLSGLSPAMVVRRLAPLNLVMLVLFAVLPLTTRGGPLLTLGPLDLSTNGLRLAASIALKGNAIVLALLVLLGRLDPTTLGHAMSHLRVPGKLIHLLLFTVRYLDVLQREYRRLREAMKIRGFRPGMDRHTYRSLGYLAGMLLVRSLDRSERIVAAMKCRGFDGRFYLLDHFHYSWYDVPFAVAAAALFVAAWWFERQANG